MRLRTLLSGLALILTGTVVGVSTQQFATAGVSSGDRPILVPIEPCRLVDTRDNGLGGSRTAPLGNGEVATFDTAGSGTDCEGRIPSDAVGLATNMTAVNATAATFVTVWASGDRPTVSSLNPRPGAAPTPNSVTTGITSSGTFQVYNDVGSVGLFIDVSGYYIDHSHTDQHPTIAAFDEARAASKHITINVYESTDVFPANQLYADETDMGVEAISADYQFMLPPDYTAGTDLDLRLIAYMRPQNAPCRAELFGNWTNVFRPGVAQFEPGFEPTEPSGDTQVVKILLTDRVADEFEFTILGADLQPRDAVGFGLEWQSCGPIVAGIEVLYR